jgi:hypothetical protein
MEPVNEPEDPQLGKGAGLLLGADSNSGGLVEWISDMALKVTGKKYTTQEVIDYNRKNTTDFDDSYKVGKSMVTVATVAVVAEGAGTVVIATTIAEEAIGTTKGTTKGTSKGSIKGAGTTKGVETTKGASKTVNPNDIRFSQSSVNGAKETTESMKANGWGGDPIDVMKMSDGTLTTVDNTRVLAAKYAGIDVQANVQAASDPIPADIAVRFTSKNGTIPKTWGEAVTNRINNQYSTYRTTYPNGSNITGWYGK